MPQRLTDRFGNVLQWLMLVMLVSIPVCCVTVALYYPMAYPEHVEWVDDIVLLVSLCVYAFAVRCLQLPLSRRVIMAGSFVVLNAAMIAVLVCVDTHVVSDYKAIFDTANAMAAGEFDVDMLNGCDYFYIFNYQIGISALESVFVRIFGNTVLPLKVFNLLLINLTAFLTYKLAYRIANLKAALMSLALFASFYPVIVTVGQFTNQHVAAPLILGALILLLSGSWRKWALAGVLTALLDVMRPMGIILLIAVVMAAAYNAFRCRQIRSWAVCAVAYFALYIGFLAAFNQIFYALDYADAPVNTSKITYFKFHKGLLGYDKPVDLPRLGCDIAKFNDWEKQQLWDTVISHPGAVAAFVAKKMIRYQGDFDWKMENTFNHDPAMYNARQVKALTMWGWAQYFVVALLGAAGYWRWRKSHPLDVVQIFYIGITAVYLFIEAFSSYRYESYPVLFVFAGIGLSVISFSKKNS